jgi:hypothetical protein
MKKLLIIVSLLAVIGCKGQQGPQGPAGADGTDGTDGAAGGGTYVYGEAMNTGEVYVIVYFSPVIPWVAVNQETLNVVESMMGLLTDYKDSISISIGDSVHLKVYTDGIATASARVPGSFGITSHDTSLIADIPKGSDFTVSWSSADYCDFYRVHLSLHYGYSDTLGNDGSFYFRMDTCVTSTSITFLASQLFPADVDSVTHSGGGFNVWAMNGPILEPGSKGNVTGNGSGFFWGSADGGHLDIRVEGTKGKAQKELSREELRHRWFEKAKAIDPNYQALKEEFQRVPYER